jgi:hypothetical protein
MQTKLTKRNSMGSNAGCVKRMTWPHEKLGKSGSGGLLYRYRRYFIQWMEKGSRKGHQQNVVPLVTKEVFLGKVCSSLVVCVCVCSWEKHKRVCERVERGRRRKGAASCSTNNARSAAVGAPTPKFLVLKLAGSYQCSSSTWTGWFYTQAS